MVLTLQQKHVEGLNSSLAQSAAKQWLAKVCPERTNYTFHETFSFLSKAEFLNHNFGSRYATKSIKSSEDSDDSLVSNKSLIQKMAR